MDATRISSTPRSNGVIRSAASMPRISPPQGDDAAAIHAYRRALVERHLRETLLQQGGRFESPHFLNLWDLIFHCTTTEHPVGCATIATVISSIQAHLRPDEKLSDYQVSFRLAHLSAEQRRIIGDCIAASALPISQMTRLEKEMAWFDHPDWLAEDCTMAAALLAEQLAWRRANISY